MQGGTSDIETGPEGTDPGEGLDGQRRFAQVVLDISTRALDNAFDYELPHRLASKAQIGCLVSVDFANRPAVGYVVGLSEEPSSSLRGSRIKPVREVLSSPFFDAEAVEVAFWMAREYLAPLSDCIRLFTPPGGTPKLKKNEAGEWVMAHPQARAVDDRWVRLSEAGQDYVPPKNAVKQRAVLETLRFGEMRVQDLALSVDNPTLALRALEKKGLVLSEHRQRIRGSRAARTRSESIDELTLGQSEALSFVRAALDECSQACDARLEVRDACLEAYDIHSERSGAESGPLGHSQHPQDPPQDPQHLQYPQVILLDGVTGSGKTEVYLQAIGHVLGHGGSACVLVPEISLTPQTVSRFCSRFGEAVAVLHSRLSAGERFDQWELVRSGQARVVVGARSALFAPLHDLRLIIIDEEHEGSYKQGSSPRYVTRDVARKRAESCGAVVVLGSATPSLESLYEAGLCDAPDTLARDEEAKDVSGTLAKSEERKEASDTCPSTPGRPGGCRFTHVALPSRVSGRPLPPVEVVDLAAEFRAGNRSMYSLSLREALRQTMERGEKAVLLLNKRGFASVLLCRDCGFVPTCEQCDTSMTFHQHPPHLLCHYCDAHAPVPPVCPECGSPYLRQLGPGTQYAADQLKDIVPPGTPVVRMDADTTRLKDGHEKRLEEFAATGSGVLLGTQMIAKGLDFADVTLVGVLVADVALKFPDFRAAERTWQLVEQVAGRAGRAEKDGKVIVQTYWPEHVAIQAAARHDRTILLREECAERAALNYPPYGRLANILVWGKDLEAVQDDINRITASLRPCVPQGWQLLGPSPCVISKRQGSYRWHLLVKAPAQADIPGWLNPLFKGTKASADVNRAVDIDPQNMM